MRSFCAKKMDRNEDSQDSELSVSEDSINCQFDRLTLRTLYLFRFEITPKASVAPRPLRGDKATLRDDSMMLVFLVYY